MTIVYALLIAHFIADFVCQTDWMAINKSKRWDALAIHCLVYISAVLLIMAPWLAGRHDAMMLFLATNLAAHFVQDAITSRITSRLWFFAPEVQSGGNPVTWDGRQCWTARGGNRNWFFVAIGFDQLLHYVTLFVTAGWWLR